MNSQDLSEIREPDTLTELETLRHSTAHVLAHAVQNLWPQTRFGIGPVIENGFYYDIELDFKLTSEDLPKIETEMKKVIASNTDFVRSELPIQEALALFKKLNQPFKIEIIETLSHDHRTQSVSTYQEGEFIDLCRGPHIQNAGQIKAFKLLSLAGAYWRANEKNAQLQRIYGTAFFTQSELEEHLQLVEEAKKRDHRKLGKELDLFSFHPEAPACPFFHPKGTLIYNRLTELMRSLYIPYQYEEIITPQILDVALWKKSGHYENYKENMYFTEVDQREFAIKPMNCPASTFVFASHKRSYRELPLRLADFGRLHRYEKSGTLAGLTRVRSMCQDDAHIFCTPEQIESEIKSVVDMILQTYALFDFSDIKIFLSIRPEKRVGESLNWDQAEKALKSVLDSLNRPYQINPGEGAFYGPKIDFHVKDALKRSHQLGTIQLDFNTPERFDLEYIASDNSAKRPVMIHRAVLGTFERFIGILIEHLAGVFPFWLAPVQVRLITIKDTHKDYCFAYLKKLKTMGIRAECDSRNESMGFKIREAQVAKIPYSLVAGDRETQNLQFSARKHGERESKTLSQEELLTLFKDLNTYPNQILER